MRRSPLPDPAAVRPGASLGAAAGVFSRNSLAFPHLDVLLGVSSVIGFPRAADAAGLDFVVGWGDKPSAGRPRSYGARHGVPFLAAEDGFLRSVGAHRIKPPPLSLVLDDEGIYYRAATPSRLERLIGAAPGFAPAVRGTAERALVRVRSEKLTKYNVLGASAPAAERPVGILLVDQVFGDQSIAGGLASAASFSAMVTAALAETDAADIAVKIHPDVLAGRATGYLLEHARRHGLALLADAGNPFDLLARVGRVFTVSSQLGFEALLAEVPVRTFGVPFYAGWGLTEDTPSEPAAGAALARRGARRSLAEVFAAAYVAYPRYADPVRREVIGVEQAIDRLLEWREVLAPRRGSVTLLGAPLDARLAEAVFGGGGAPVTVAPGGQDRPGAGVALSWGNGASRRPGVGVVRPALLRDDRLARVYGFEGGLHRDPSGDPFAPGAALDTLLSTGTIGPAEQARAGAVLTLLARTAFARVGLVAERRVAPASGDPKAPSVAVLLAAAGEAAVPAGTPLPGEAAIVGAVQAERPDAAVIVLRERPRPAADRWRQWRSTLLPPRLSPAPAPRPMPTLLGRVVAVHTDAAAGALDALALGLPVVVHGPALYAGWGFTDDRNAPPRARRLSFEDFIALLAVRGMEWTDPVSGLPATAEEVMRLFETEPRPRPDPGILLTLDRLEKRLRRLLPRRR